MRERYLADENFPGAMVRLLRDQDNDVLYAAETLISAQDEIVLQTAATENRILLTFDRDFGELAFRRRKSQAPGIVLFRIGSLSPEALFTFIESFFSSQPTLRGFFTVASPGHFRQVPSEQTKATRL